MFYLDKSTFKIIWESGENEELRPNMEVQGDEPGPCPSPIAYGPLLLLFTSLALSHPARDSHTSVWTTQFCLQLCPQLLSLGHTSGLGVCAQQHVSPQEERKGEGKSAVQAFGSKLEGEVAGSLRIDQWKSGNKHLFRTHHLEEGIWIQNNCRLKACIQFHFPWTFGERFFY